MVSSCFDKRPTDEACAPVHELGCPILPGAAYGGGGRPDTQAISGLKTTCPGTPLTAARALWFRHSEGLDGMRARVVFDGANIAFPQGFEGSPDLERCQAVILGVCDRLGLDPAREVVTIFDAGFHNHFNSRQQEELRRLRAQWGQDRIAACPAGQRADKWILDFAHMMDAVVVSGDRYRDHPNRHGAVLVPVLHVGGSVVLRTGLLMGATDRDDQEVDLATIFPVFTERRLAAMAPRDLSRLVAPNRTDLDRLSTLVRDVLSTTPGAPWRLEALASAVGETLGPGWLERTCMHLVLRQLHGVAVFGTVETGITLGLNGQVEPKDDQRSGTSQRQGEPRQDLKGPSSPERDQLLRVVYQILQQSEGGCAPLSFLADRLGKAFPDGQFKEMVMAIEPGSSEGRFRRLLQRQGLHLWMNENNQWWVARRPPGPPRCSGWA